MKKPADVRVLRGLTEIIQSTLQRQVREEYEPSTGADEMDAIIGNAKKRVQHLRELREALEDEFARPL